MEIKFTSEITVELIQGMRMGSDAAVAAAAKVLEPQAYQNYLLQCYGISIPDCERESPEGLINYMMKHRHGTPFEHGGASLFVRAPIFVWREWHRHRIGWSYNEESARYKQLEPLFYVPPPDRPMNKVEGWKPGRPKFTSVLGTNDQWKHYDLCNNLKEVYELAYEKYEENLKLGIDPGLARDCLPVGIYSSCWVTCNPRSIMAFLSLRTHEEAAKFVSYPLYEIEIAARKVEAIFQEHWPLTHKAFCENGRVGP